MLIAGACSSSETPETLPMIEDAPAASTTTTSTTVSDRVEPGVDDAVAELTAEQQSLLDGCADALNEAANSVDSASPTYSDDVTAILMDPTSGAMASCGALFDPASGIDQGIVISFMIESLPPELLGTLSALATATGPDGEPLMPGAPGSADSTADSTVADDGDALS